MRALLLLLLAAALLAAGCGGGPSSGAPAPGGGPSSGVPGPGGGLTVAEARASELDGPLLVRGYLFDVDGVVHLCDAIAESYPPQCGGERLRVEGAPADPPWRSEGDVRWTEEVVSLIGRVDGDVLRVDETAA